jgi:hypothetical protein
MKEILAKGAADLSKMTAERDELQKKVEKLEAEPAPAKGVAKVVGQRRTTSSTDEERRARGHVPARPHEESAANPTLIKL